MPARWVLLPLVAGGDVSLLGTEAWPDAGCVAAAGSCTAAVPDWPLSPAWRPACARVESRFTRVPRAGTLVVDGHGCRHGLGHRTRRVLPLSASARIGGMLSAESGDEHGRHTREYDREQRSNCQPSSRGAS